MFINSNFTYAHQNSEKSVCKQKSFYFKKELAPLKPVHAVVQFSKHT